MADTKFHPALGVSNIKNHIQITLEFENVQYSTWAELFKICARSHKVLHHIIPSEKEKAHSEPKNETEEELWSTLDATVLGWIYSTISTDLLQTIIVPGSTAMEAWNRLRDLFEDNKHSRAVALEQEFSHTLMEDFPNVSTYCQRLKELSDQLKNVDAPVSNDRLVLQMVSGLTEAFNGIGTLLRQSNPLPPFYQARSMLTLEEAGLAKKAATASNSALVAQPPVEVSGNPMHGNGGRRNLGGRNGGKSRGSDRGKNKTGGRGNNGGGSNAGDRRRLQQSPTAAPWLFPMYGRGGGGVNSWGYPSPPSWPWPPCPYPSTWASPNYNNSNGRKGEGVLGPRPQQAQQQAFSATSEFASTDIESAM
ncbi:uncharacterized protein LOC130015417, partial [Mercurialis annua]|uniref:uncharacterized protein LOC130015417 n=1 Tax=Mercurialis annua TaxID=3986 RepID=UPI0024AFCF63